MLKRVLVTAVLLLATAQGAAAQRWDAPLFFSPRQHDDIGVYYMRTDRDDDFVNDESNGLKLIWRQSGNLNLGVHVGTGDIENIGESILLGAELYGPLAGIGAGTGLLVNWSAGIGAAFGDLGNDVDYIDFSVPVGVSLGLRLGSGSTVLVPFIHPRVSLDVVSVTVADVEETETEVGFAADLGAEFGLGERFLLRGAYTFGKDRDALGVGLAYRIPRGVVVR
jgi:opacity protein-like surface antigen